MATLTVSGGSISLESKWKCKRALGDTAEAGALVKYTFDSKPDTGTGSVTFTYSLPSGVNIKSATVTGSLGSPMTGISLCTANGSSFRGSVGISLSGESGSVSVTFAFKANGKIYTDTDIHKSRLTISNLLLQIEYEEGEEDENGTDDTEALVDAVFNPPPQSVCIYDQDTGKTYVFDGVTKIQEECSVKIEEDPSTKKELYVNNARNEPDKVKIDVMMSDVYTGSSSITIATSEGYVAPEGLDTENYITGGDTRSATAAQVLHALKKARDKLTIVTPHMVFVDMLFQDMTIMQDSSCPYGWTGQVTFQEMYEVKIKKDITNSTADSANSELLETGSMLYNMFNH